MTLKETLLAVADLRDQAAKLAPELAQHVLTERDPARHAALHRMHRVVHDLLLAMPVAP